jgi:hypothetical protein
MKVPVQQMESPHGPFECMSVDTLGPLNTIDGFTYIIIFMDYFSRWAIACPCSDQKAETVARLLLDRVVTQHGVPNRLLSDQGTNYTSKVMTELYALMGVSRLVTSGYHPQTNGLVERFNHTIVQILRTLCDIRSENWPEYVQTAVFAYNTSIQTTLAESPFYIVYGRECRLPGDVLLQPTELHFRSAQDYINVLVERVSWAYRFVKNQLEERRKQYLSTIRYLKGTINLKLTFGKGNKTNDTNETNYDLAHQHDLEVFTDADYANDQQDRKSVSGAVIKLNGDVVNWITKKQSTVATSTCEAECYAVHCGLQDVRWLKNLLEELQLQITTPIIIHCDNQAVVHLCKNESDHMHGRSKHFDVKYHSIKEHVENDTIV